MDSEFEATNRTSWLRDGDCNTTFFYRLHHIRKARTGINALNVDRVVTTDLGAISDHIVQFYWDLFRASNREPPDFALVHELISPVVSASQNEALIACPTPDEVKGVVFALSRDSAPGPDGFGGSFYQGLWGCCG
ncbi:hypothetical protein ACS0TY_006882 [Phlomoides rotata]